MSEGIITAFITAAGSLLGAVAGQLIAASATVRAAAIKESTNIGYSSRDEKSISWVGILGGALAGAVLTLIILALLGLFPPRQNKIDAIAGTWVGTAKGGEYAFDVRFTIGEACEIGSTCGTFDIPAIPCSGTLAITRIDGDVFEFQANDRTSGCNPAPEIRDSLQLLPDGTLLYISRGNSTVETRGVLKKEK